MKCSCCGNTNLSNNVELAKHIIANADDKHKKASEWARQYLDRVPRATINK